MIINRKKLAGYWHIMSYHDIQHMPKTACIQWNICDLGTLFVSLICSIVQVSHFFHISPVRYGYVSFKHIHIQAPYRKVIFSWFGWGTWRHLAVMQDFSAPIKPKRSPWIWALYGQTQRFTNDKKNTLIQYTSYTSYTSFLTSPAKFWL